MGRHGQNKFAHATRRVTIQLPSDSRGSEGAGLGGVGAGVAAGVSDFGEEGEEVVVVCAAEELVGAEGAEEVVFACGASDGVVAGLASELVVAVLAFED